MKVRLLEDIINLIYPAECHICGNLLAPHERFACAQCLESLPRTGYHRHRMNPMEERFAGQFPFEAATGHFFYSRDSSLSRLIQDMKYRNFPSIGDMLGEISGRELMTAGFLSEIDVIVPVPMHFLKQAKRGYNQTHRIASGISKATGLPVERALKMTRRHTTQTALSRQQRMKNSENLFDLKDSDVLNGKNILLVDDVCTTGATLSAAGKCISDGCENVKLTLFSIGVTF